MNNKHLILVKIGGSVITDKTKPYSVKRQILKRLAKELASPHQLVISHGAGSFGHTSAKQYGGMHGYKSTQGIAKIIFDSQSINTIVMNALLAQNLSAVSLNPTSFFLTKKGEIQKVFFDPLEEMLKQNIIPVVYGSVLWDSTWKSTIYSGEKLLDIIASHLLNRGYAITRIIQVGQTNGVLNGKGETITEINQTSWKEVKQFVNGSSGTDVTGGMEHKIATALESAKQGIETWIINGTIPNQLGKAINNEIIEGTIIT